MKYIVLCLMALLFAGCKEKPIQKFGGMTRTIHRTETIRPVGSEDFGNYSALFIEETIAEGTQILHTRYIIAGMDTLDWPKELGIDDAVILLSGNEDNVQVYEDIYTGNGLKDFVFFWQSKCQRINYNCYIVWSDEGKPSIVIKEIEGFGGYVYKTNRISVLLFIFVIPMLIFCGFILGKQPRTDNKHLLSINRMLIGMFIFGAIISIYGTLTGAPSQEGDTILIFIANVCIIALLGIISGKIYRRIKEITSIRNFGFSGNMRTKKPNDSGNMELNEHNL